MGLPSIQTKKPLLHPAELNFMSSLQCFLKLFFQKHADTANLVC